MDLTIDIIKKKKKSGCETTSTILECNLLEIIRVLTQKTSISFHREIVEYETIDLSKSNISTIQAEAFGSHAQKLSHVDLSDNELKTIQRQDFKYLTNLLTLNCARNQINLLENDAFSGNEILRKILF